MGSTPSMPSPTRPMLPSKYCERPHNPCPSRNMSSICLPCMYLSNTGESKPNGCENKKKFDEWKTIRAKPGCHYCNELEIFPGLVGMDVLKNSRNSFSNPSEIINANNFRIICFTPFTVFFINNLGLLIIHMFSI